MGALTLILALFIGIVLGMVGSGGSIMAVPMLAYVAGMDPKQAIAVAHLLVAVTSAVTAVPHARAGHIQWRTGMLLGGAGSVGAYIGGLLARFVSGTALFVGFATVVTLTGFAMLRRGDGATTEDGRQPLAGVVVLLGGLAIGLVSGLVGAGGGVFVVPFLLIAGSLSMSFAVGTSLVVTSLNSFAGLGGYLTHVHVDFKVAAVITVITVIGGQIGARQHARVAPMTLRRAFGLFALGISSITFGRELGTATGVAVAVLTTLFVAIMLVRKRLRGHHGGTPMTTTPGRMPRRWP